MKIGISLPICLFMVKFIFFRHSHSRSNQHFSIDELDSWQNKIFKVSPSPRPEMGACIGNENKNLSHKHKTAHLNTIKFNSTNYDKKNKQDRIPRYRTSELSILLTLDRSWSSPSLTNPDEQDREYNFLSTTQEKMIQSEAT